MALPDWLQPLLIRALPVVVTGLASTWRVRFEGLEHLGAVKGGEAGLDARRLFALWHGRQLCLVPGLGESLARAPLVVMVSASRDGQLQAPVLHQLGMETVVGSSSRKGGSGLVLMARRVAEGAGGLLAVDGPAGPPFCAKSGLVALSRLTGVPIVPVGAEVDRTWTVPETWDGFWIPKPGARVCIRFGRPIPAPGPGREAQAATLDAVQRALATLNATTPVTLRTAHSPP